MTGKLGTILMCLGTVLLIMALSLFLYNAQEARSAGESAGDLLPQIMEEVPARETRPPVNPGAPVELLAPEDVEMTEVEIDGHLYIGYLAIPDLDLELPILSGWSYEQLQIAPCRFTGTVRSRDLVLMAHNFPTHFGKLQNLAIGAKLSFTDMDGATTRYEVAAIEVLAPTAVEDMISGEFDLTLFTCTYGGKNRVTIRCDRMMGD